MSETKQLQLKELLWWRGDAAQFEGINGESISFAGWTVKQRTRIQRLINALERGETPSIEVEVTVHYRAVEVKR